MKRSFFVIFAFCMISYVCIANVTLEQCLNSARENYPLIKQYDLITATECIELSDINKSWLPKINAYTQVSMQNVVPSFPSALTHVMSQMGGDIEGLGKLQYKIGVDVNQTIWDGGATKSHRDITRLRTDVNKASLEVELYSIQQRVESLYFGILLIQSQLEQIDSSIEVYQSNLNRLRSMLKNGTAMQSDVDMIEAQLLTIQQQQLQAKYALKGYRDMLSLFTGINLTNEFLILPEFTPMTDYTNNRPELKLFSAQEKLNHAKREGINASIAPKIGLFAQSYYGYPGIDYFKAMMKRDMTFNIIAGLRVSWNIDAYYTKKNSLKNLDIINQEINTQRETFLLNSNMQLTSQMQEILGLESIMKDDAKILELRRNVRKAAESQLRNGIIDATSLTTKINDETQAALAAVYHKIQKTQAIYNLKNTLNQ